MYSLTILFFMMLYWEYQTPERYLEPIGQYSISRYYSVMPDQRRYYLWRTYHQDKEMNCWGGSCLDTASGYHLTNKDEFKIVACPKSFEFGTILHIEGVGDVTCQDRGGSIKNKRLDLWTGIGDKWLSNIFVSHKKAGLKNVSLVKYK